LPEAAVAAILHLRQTLRLTAAAIDAKPGLARSTVWRWLEREGLCRLAQRDPPAPVRRDRRERPGGMIHSRRFARALRLLAIRHTFTRTDRPKTNGRAEGFIQTLTRERACGLPYPSSEARDAALPRWLDGFNRSRPHAAGKRLSPRGAVNTLVRIHTYRSPAPWFGGGATRCGGRPGSSARRALRRKPGARTDSGFTVTRGRAAGPLRRQVKPNMPSPGRVRTWPMPLTM
jgi:hypothetical protein